MQLLISAKRQPGLSLSLICSMYGKSSDINNFQQSVLIIVKYSPLG